MPRLSFHTLDVFTSKPLTGNPLAVIRGADELETNEMQAIAREFMLSETVFVLTPHNPLHSARLRIFTSARELPFAGHPTIGTAVLLAEQQFSRDAKHESLIVLEEHIGVIRCGIKIEPGEATIAEFDVPKLAFETDKPPPRERISLALGLMPSDIGFDNHKPTRFSSGVEYLCVPVRDRDALHRARPMGPVWPETIGTSAYVYTRLPEGNASTYRARMFSFDRGGMHEDPATGAAAAAFAGSVARYEGFSDGWHSFSLEQGIEMGRPSTIMIEMEITAGRLSSTRIGGQAIVVSEGHLQI